jgi:hypothetical protein
VGGLRGLLPSPTFETPRHGRGPPISAEKNGTSMESCRAEVFAGGALFSIDDPAGQEVVFAVLSDSSSASTQLRNPD